MVTKRKKSKFEELIKPKPSPIPDNRQSKASFDKPVRVTQNGKQGVLEKGVFFEDDPAPTKEFDVLRDETGRLSGFTRGDTTLLGLPPSEVRALAEKEAGLQELEVGGAAEAALAKKAEQQQREGLDLSAQVGQDPMSQLEQQFSAQGVDYIAALASGVPGLIPDIIAGGLSGFALGTSATAVTSRAGPPGAVVGAGITTTTTIALAMANAVRGFWSDYISDISRQKGELIETPIRTLTETKSIMNDIDSAQNANPAEAINNLEAFNQQLQLIDDEFDRLKDLTDDDLNKFLGVNGINQLQEYEVYYTRGGERDRQIRDFQLSLANPDPANIRVGGNTLKQLRDRIDQELRELW